MKSVFAALVLLPALAHGDPVRIATAALEGPPGANEPVDQPPPAVPSSRSAIVGASRGLVLATAMTVPEGKLEWSVRLLSTFAGGMGIHVGVSRTTELWAEAGGMRSEETSTPIFGVGAKQVLARRTVDGRDLQVAATGSIRHIETSTADDGQLATLGGVVTLCGDGCRVMGTLGTALLFVEDEEVSFMWSFGLSVGNDTTRLFGELGTVLDRRHDGGLTGLALGVRFGTKKVAVDAGLLRLFRQDDLVLPMLSVLIRS